MAVVSSSTAQTAGTSSGAKLSSRAFVPTSSFAPLSARMCATCARLSNGLIGTWTSPARAAAKGKRHVSSPFAAQLATRAPGSGTMLASHAASWPTRVLKAL